MEQKTRNTLEAIRFVMEKNPLEPQAYRDLYQMIRELPEEEKRERHEWSQYLIQASAKALQKQSDPYLMEQYYEVWKGALKLDSKDCLDSYLLFLESGRLPEERFYQPRRRILKNAVEIIQDLVDGKLDEAFIAMPPRVGKLLSDSTPVLTTEGWKNHGDLRVGDWVYSPDGGPVEIIAVHPKHHTTHTVTMTDGSEFKCHFRHEWKVYDRSRQRWRVLETQEMMKQAIESGTPGKRGHRYRFQLPIAEPLIGIETKLPVDPYVFGVWLGDGSTCRPRITGDKNDRIIREEVAKHYPEHKEYIHKITGVVSWDYIGLRGDLQALGLCHSKHVYQKHIPDIYLTASLRQRLELLAGLLDTDGTLRRSEHRYDFTTSDEPLKEDFISLVRTFGWRTCVVEVEPGVSSGGIVGKHKYWVVSFNPTMEIPCRLERKQLREFSKPRRIAIKSIEESEEESGNCITVASKDGMYLVGKTLTPTHNTSLCMFVYTWLIGKNSETSNLYVAFSDVITSAFYSGVLEVLNDPYTYKWKEVFPDAKIVHTNSKEETINIDRNKRYPSLTCRSLYGTLNGACDCSGLLMSDDLIGGIEEALNPNRLQNAWSKVDNNMLTRAKGLAKILWVGTRWSIADPAGRRIDLLENDPKFADRKYKVLNLPALNEKDESNFDYDYGVGFSTAFYHQRRASFEHNNDLASWYSQYQQQPIEREGALFTPETTRMYNGILPEEAVTKVFMAVDPAFGGGDFVAGPVCVKTESGDIYVEDVIYDDADKKETIPKLARLVIRHGVRHIQFAVNKMTMSYREEFEKELKKQNPAAKVTITTKADPNQSSKEQRIFEAAPDIRDTMVFLEPSRRTKEYQMFMQNMFGFTVLGKNRHDDAPDSLAMAIDMDLHPSGIYRIMRREF